MTSEPHRKEVLGDDLGVDMRRRIILGFFFFFFWVPGPSPERYSAENRYPIWGGRGPGTPRRGRRGILYTTNDRPNVYCIEAASKINTGGIFILYPLFFFRYVQEKRPSIADPNTRKINNHRAGWM